MTLTIELNATERARLTAAAKEEGLAPEEMARRLVTSHLPPAAEALQEDATLALFRQWAEEDARRSPQEAEAENELWERFQANLNETRALQGMRQL
jgi:hypothetical protein